MILLHILLSLLIWPHRSSELNSQCLLGMAMRPCPVIAELTKSPWVAGTSFPAVPWQKVNMYFHFCYFFFFKSSPDVCTFLDILTSVTHKFRVRIPKKNNEERANSCSVRGSLSLLQKVSWNSDAEKLFLSYSALTKLTATAVRDI